jgi:hypothetical protein
MAGFFLLELDTTSPDIVINAPNYITKDTEMEIVITSDEILSDGFQDFYIIDQYGNKHSYIFSYDSNEYIGKMTLSNFDNGWVTFYARVKDEVDNLSVLASKTIQIIPSVNYLRLSIEDSICINEIEMSGITKDTGVSILKTENNLSISSEARNTTTSNVNRDMKIDSNSRINKIMTEVVKE